jgi:hypothetical protein
VTGGSPAQDEAVTLRVALLVPHGDDAGAACALALAAALGERGHDARLVRSRPVAAAEAVLSRRGFTPALSAVPGTYAALARGGFDVAHAFAPVDAAAALAWRRRSGAPVVFTCARALGRGDLADRRLRLTTLRAALEDSDALTAANEDVRAALERWVALDPPVLDAGDAEAHERLYMDVLRGRPRGQ